MLEVISALMEKNSDLENRIRELENEVTFLKGKIEGMRSVPLPIQPVYGERLPYTGNPVELPYEVPSTKKSWEPPYEVTCLSGADTTGFKKNPHSFVGPEREITPV